MIRLFGGGRADHPLADPKEAKRIFDSLPPDDAAKALEELARKYRLQPVDAQGNPPHHPIAKSMEYQATHGKTEKDT